MNIKKIRSQTIMEEVKLFHYLDKKEELTGLSPKEYGLFTSLLNKYGSRIYQM